MKFRKILCLTFVLLCIGLTFNGFQPSVTTNVNKIEKQVGNDWLIMVYIAADNNLEEAGIDDINEMEAINLPSSVKVVVQFDRHEAYDETHGNWSETRRYVIDHDDDVNQIQSPCLEQMGEQNMGDPRVLRDFISWGISSYPASHKALIFWDHGGGWNDGYGGSTDIFDKNQDDLTENLKEHPKKSFDSPRKWACHDDYYDDFLSENEIQAALNGYHFDIIGFDACIMGTMEIAYDFVNLADIFIASAESEGFDGWPYDTILNQLAINPTIEPVDFASKIVDEYIVSYCAGGTQGIDNYATMCAFDLTKMNNVIMATNEAFSFLKENLNEIGVNSILNAIDDCSSYGRQIDFLAFVENLKEEITLSSWNNLADTLIIHLNDAVINAQHNVEHNDAKSLSIYTPTYKEDYTTDYDLSVDDWVRETNYDEFLKEFTKRIRSRFDTMNPILPGKNSFSIELNQNKFFKFEADRKTAICVVLEHSFSVDFDLYLYDSDYQRIALSAGYDSPEVVEWYAFHLDIFAIRVSSWEGSGGFTLNLTLIPEPIAFFDINNKPISIEFPKNDANLIDILKIGLPVEVMNSSNYLISIVLTNSSYKKIFSWEVTRSLSSGFTNLIIEINGSKIYKLELHDEIVTLHVQIADSDRIFDQMYNITNFSLNSEDFVTPKVYFDSSSSIQVHKIYANETGVLEEIVVTNIIYIIVPGTYQLFFRICDIANDPLAEISVWSHFTKEEKNATFNATIPLSTFFGYEYLESYSFKDFVLMDNTNGIQDRKDKNLPKLILIFPSEIEEDQQYKVNWYSGKNSITWDFSLAVEDSNNISVSFYIKRGSLDWITLPIICQYILSEEDYDKPLQLKIVIKPEGESFEILSPIMKFSEPETSSSSPSNIPGFEMISFILLLGVIVLRKKKKN